LHYVVDNEVAAIDVSFERYDTNNNNDMNPEDMY
jgi:hypothetical protein